MYSYIKATAIVCFLLLSLNFPEAGLEAQAVSTRTLSFSGAGKGGTFPGALVVEGKEISVDLSRLPPGSAILRAILRVKADPPRRYGNDAGARERIRIVPADPSGAPVSSPLRLRPPRYLDFDATGAVQALFRAASRSERPLILLVEKFPGFRPGGTRLDVTARFPAGTAAGIPGAAGAVTDLQAWHRSGQTFITWKEPEPILLREEVTIGELREARARAEKGPEIRFRIYRSAAPLTEKTIAGAELIDEVGPFTIWNGEFHGIDPKPQQPALRYAVRTGEPPLPPGHGVYVHGIERPGTSWYAAVLARNGEEDFSSLSRAGSAAGPIEETPGPGEPVLQRRENPETFMYVENPALHYYVRWESPPRANLPSRPFDYLVGIPPEPGNPAPLCVGLHCWGGSLRGGYGWWYGARDGAMFLATNQIPYDWWACYHESLDTLKSFQDGVARSYSPKRVWAFVEWMQKKWPIDRNRIFTGGSSMGGSGVSHWIRYGDRFAYGISWVGVHIPALSPGFRGSYERVVGKVEWNIPHESGIPVFDYLDDARFLREHPAVETPFLAYSNGKNDSGIGWKQAVEFTRALQETRRPHLFVWGQGGHGQRAYFPTDRGGGDNVRSPLDIRLDRSLPAFTRCSLDDDPGTGDPGNGDAEGQINRYLRWRTGEIVDEPDRWSVVVYLIERAPAERATVDVTPRRLQAFRPGAGKKYSWTAISLEGGRLLQRGQVTADRWGLLTLERVEVGKNPIRLEIRR